MRRPRKILAILATFGPLVAGRAVNAQDQHPPTQPAVEEVSGAASPHSQAPEAGAAPSPTTADPPPVERFDAPSRPSAPPPWPPPQSPPPWYAPPPSPSAPPSLSSGSYGGQIVLVDLGAVLVGALASQQAQSATPILVSWIFASPVVHVVHGHPGRALGSLLLHVGMPIVGAYVGVQAEDCGNSSSDSGFCGLGGLVLGGLAGMIAATTIDAAFLAQSSDEHPVQLAGGRGGASTPALSIGHRGDVTLGWRGTF